MQQRARGRARGVRDALGDVLPARPAHAQPDQDARWRAARPCASAGRRRAAALPSAPPPVARGRGARRSPRRPVLPPDVPQHFVPVRGTAPPGAALVYQPMLFGAAEIRFADAKKGFDTSEPVAIMTAVTTEAVAVDWERGRGRALAAERSRVVAGGGRSLRRVAARRAQAEELRRLEKELAAWLFRTRTLELFACPRLRAFSKPGESEGDFRARLQHAGREKRDQAVEQLRKKYAPKIAALQEKIRRAEQAVERESEQASAARAPGGDLDRHHADRRHARPEGRERATLGRATTAARGAGRVLKERQDIGRAKETRAGAPAAARGSGGGVQGGGGHAGRSGDALAEPLETLRRAADQAERHRQAAWRSRGLRSGRTAAAQSTPAWR